MTPQDIEQVMQCLQPRTVPAQTRLITAGRPVAEFLLLVSGTVRIGGVREELKPLIIGLRGPCEVLGEISLIDGLPPTANVTTEEQCSLLCMSRDSFYECMMSVPQFAINIARILTRRMRIATDQIQWLAGEDVTGRVCCFLQFHAQEYGVPHPRGTLIPMRITHEVLAQMVSFSRQRVSAVVASLKRKGILSTISGSRFVIHDLDSLHPRTP